MWSEVPTTSDSAKTQAPPPFYSPLRLCQPRFDHSLLSARSLSLTRYNSHKVESQSSMSMHLHMPDYLIKPIPHNNVTTAPAHHSIPHRDRYKFKSQMTIRSFRHPRVTLSLEETDLLHPACTVDTIMHITLLYIR